MNSIIMFFLIPFLSIQLVAQNVLTSSEIDILKNEVKKTATQTRTIKSDFKQYKHLSFLSNDIITYGKLAFKAPNLVKWEYIKPYKYSVVFKDNSLLINDDGKKSNVNISSGELFLKMNELIVKSISGDMFDENEFDILYYKTEKSYLVKFITKNTNFKKFISSFELVFLFKSYEVKQVTMFEPSGDYTKIVFKNRIVNYPIKDELFTN